MSGPGQHAGALEITTGSLVFQHTSQETVNIGTAHYKEFVTIMTDAIDGVDATSTVFDPNLPTDNKHLSFFPSESNEGSATLRRMNTACGVDGTGLNQATNPTTGTQPWTLAFWGHMTMDGNTSPPARPNGHNTHIMNCQINGVDTVKIVLQASVERFYIQLRDNSNTNAVHNENGSDGSLSNEQSDLFFTNCFATTADQFAHYAFVHDGTADDIANNTRLYVNGALHTNTSTNNRRTNGTSNYNMAEVKFQGWNTLTMFNQASQTGVTSNTGCYQHKFDEMVMWTNRALTLSEVQELYNNGNTFDMTTHSRYSDLTAYWAFDTGSIINTTLPHTQPAFKMIDSKGSNHLTSSITANQSGRQDNRLALSGSSLQQSGITGGFKQVPSNGQWNANIENYGEYDHSTGNLTIYTTAPFSGSINYKVVSRDFRDRGY